MRAWRGAPRARGRLSRPRRLIAPYRGPLNADVRPLKPAMSERLAFLVVIGIALLVSAGLVHLDLWDKAQQLKVETRNLLKNRAIWFASDISNYNFSIVHFSAGGAPPPMRVVVTNGVVQSANLSCPFPHTQDFCRKWEASSEGHLRSRAAPSRAKTIPQLFDQVYMSQKGSHEGRARVVAEFDPAFGFPTRFSFDDPKGEDEEWGFEISQFAIIQ